MMPGESLERRYYLVCTNPRKRYWWERFFEDGYRHCYILVWEGVAWLYIDPSLPRTHVSILDWYDGRHPAEWIEDPDANVIEAVVERSEGMRVPWILGFVTCVEECKSILGIRSFWIWTPKQLAKRVRRMYGRRRKETEEDSRGEGLPGCSGAGTRSHPAGDRRAQAQGVAVAVLEPRQPVVRQ